MSAPERLLSPELKEYVMRRSGIESMDAPELDKTRQSIMAPEHHPLPDGLQVNSCMKLGRIVVDL